MTANENGHTEPIDPRSIGTYLSAKGWQVQIQGSAQIWTHSRDSGAPDELRFPAESTAPDFASQVMAALQRLEQIEGRSQQVIRAEIVNAEADMLRVTIQHMQTDDPRLTIENGVRLVQGLQRLLAAAVWGNLAPSPFLSGKKPPQVGHYIRTVRVSALEGSGQVVTSPLQEIDEETLARQVMLTLAKALRTFEYLIPAQVTSSDKRREMIDQGISANLCDAFVQMFGKPDSGDKNRASLAATQLDVDFIWSPMLSVPQDTPAHLRFDTDLIPVLQDLSSTLRETSPQENFQLRGLVTSLKRTGDSGVGKVVVTNVLREQPSRVLLELDDELYDVAIQAHRAKAPVLCVGTLAKHNRSFELLEPSIAMAEAEPAE